MKWTETELDGVYIVEPELVVDERGFFARTFSDDEFGDHDIETGIRQSSIAFNEAVATLRGLHYQDPPHQETKFVCCTAGRVFDVVVDMRPTSATRLEWISCELSESNRKLLVVPPGCAHGYVTLEPATQLSYLITEVHTPGVERGVRWNDPSIGIAWPVNPEVISDRDATFPLLQG